jgi:hypothetical protein
MPVSHRRVYLVSIQTAIGNVLQLVCLVKVCKNIARALAGLYRVVRPYQGSVVVQYSTGTFSETQAIDLSL